MAQSTRIRSTWRVGVVLRVTGGLQKGPQRFPKPLPDLVDLQLVEIEHQDSWWK